VIAVFPLRDVLSSGHASADRQADPPGKRGQETEVTLLFGQQAGDEASAAEEDDADKALPINLPPAPIEGSIFLPLAVVMKNIPGFSPPAGAEQAQVELLLALIVPQLKEGKIILAARDLAPHLPVGVIVEQEAVELPLREVVLSLPPEVLELPPANPPAWARVDGLEEEVLFAAA